MKKEKMTTERFIYFLPSFTQKIVCFEKAFAELKPLDKCLQNLQK